MTRRHAFRVPPEPCNRRRMRHRLPVSLEPAKPTVDTRTGTSASVDCRQGLNFDRDLGQFGGVVEWTIAPNAVG